MNARSTFGTLKRVASATVPSALTKSLVNGKAHLRNKILTDRLPPHSIEAEQGVLGCILWQPETTLNTLAAQLQSPDEFYDLRHREIYEAAQALHEDGIGVDMISMYQALQGRKLLEGVGGLEYLNTLQDVTPSAANLDYYLAVVKEKSLLRRMIQTCSKVVGWAYDFTGDVEEMLGEVERDVLALRGNQQKAGTIKQHVQDAIAMFEDKFNLKGAIMGLPTGFVDLDRCTDGLCPAELIVPAAFPGAGKTSLAMNMVEHAILAHGYPVAVFSQEMTAKQLVARMLCSTAKVNLKDIGRGQMSEADFPRLTSAAGRLSKSNLFLVEDAESVGQIVAESRRLKQANDIKLIVVDYLQLVTGGGKGKDSNREQEISGVAATLKRLAKELNIPVVAPSQLTDDGKLRESRAIGQHADLVMKLTSRAKEDESYPDGEPVDVFIEKNRNGPSHVTVKLMFMKKWTRFESCSNMDEGDVPPPEEPAPRYPED